MSSNRVALVTGAARGQGLAIVGHLLRDGLCVAAGDVLVDQLHAAAQDLPADRLLPLELDVADEKSWADALIKVQDRFGGLNVLVNNAGVLGRALLAEETVDEFERLFRINCVGQFLGMRACLPLLRQADRPAIVNTLSSAAVRAYDRSGAYAASKFAARGLTLTAAIEFAEFGIRVNAVLPGPIATPMHDAATIERLASSPLLGRAGRAEDIARVVAFLASPLADFMTGAEVLVDGGQTLKIAH
jgi:3alpha(or 20beta)-hydroxysteroid dehydrogenase